MTKMNFCNMVLFMRMGRIQKMKGLKNGKIYELCLFTTYNNWCP